ncbi:hypothetical protein [Phaeobacter gallaeciensis]|uniref:hypothetical protein n=1 Tax=Phaeobacter gallaeciensis TaxID=60890 RepID=UPI000BBFF474|nr:hypothetical protein [Phaeobacter gallaeciensis]ATF17230.1 hypothetical protein PhaeoP129_00570 [Phaeobacter gallaeciensis]ATF21339.1 hypothetical protein PhaeoP128_00570 [Phaeobacter gallaeciensis]
MKHEARRRGLWGCAVIGMVVATSLVGAEEARIPGAAILAPRDGDILSSPVDLDLWIPADGRYQLSVDGVVFGPDPLPHGPVSLPINLPIGLYQLNLSDRNDTGGSDGVTILIDRVVTDQDNGCLRCGGLSRP